MELPSDVREALALQAGVASRRQAILAGMTDADIRRLLRRREWAVVHPGVYVVHTGPLTWLQRAWAAVLFAWPAALGHESAVRAGDGPGRRYEDDAVIHIVVDQRRTVTTPSGVRVHRRRLFDEQVRWNLSPPRLQYEHAVLDMALEAGDDLTAIGLLARAVQSRRTTALRLLDSVGERSRVRRRAWLMAVLSDIAEGTCSVLEHEYLARVERAHGLPRGSRQRRAGTSTGVVYRDVAYDALLVELDGRLFHDTAGQRDRDFERDLDAAVDGRQTLRLSWGQVHVRPCSTAAKVAAVLARRGWAGSLAACGPGCEASSSGGIAVAS